MNWQEWHGRYVDPASEMSGRLAAVRGRITRRLDETAPRPVRVVSACAGDGRDLLGVLAGRADAVRVTARLVELDPVLADRARSAAADIGADIDVITADAAASGSYDGAVPADLVLLCGIFGNICDSDIRRTVEATPSLCAPSAEVIWTRGRGGRGFDTDLTLTIRGWFTDAGFEEVAFDTSGPEGWFVGVHRLVGEPTPLLPGQRWFTFTR